MIYHITRKKDWETARKAGVYQGDTLDTEGFIHCSDEQQVLIVANSRFKGQTGLVLLVIDPDRVAPKIVRENLAGGDTLFPHIYGSLNLDAVLDVATFELGKNDFFDLPTINPDKLD
jgi:uncharacterized protein (DUF952 family)